MQYNQSLILSVEHTQMYRSLGAKGDILKQQGNRVLLIATATMTRKTKF